MVNVNRWKQIYYEPSSLTMDDIASKIVKFVKNPVEFFDSDRSTHKEVVAVATFLLRLEIAMFFLFRAMSLFFNPSAAYPSIMIALLAVVVIAAVGIVLANYFARVVLFSLATLLNSFVKIIAKHDDQEAAERIAGYSMIAGLLVILPFKFFLVSVAFIALSFLGVVKQYELDYIKSAASVALPAILVIGIIYVVRFGMNYLVDIIL